MIEKKIVTLLSICIVGILLFCGCTEQKAVKKEGGEGKITLESNVVELSASDFVKHTKWNKENQMEIVKSVEVKYLLHNLKDRTVSLEINAEFYDKNDNLVGIGGPESISLPDDYTERSYTPQNSIIYEGKNVAEVDHVILIVEEA